MPRFVRVAPRPVAPLNLMACSGQSSSSGLRQRPTPFLVFPKVLGATTKRVAPCLVFRVQGVAPAAAFRMLELDAE